jgi:alpha-tubulin suppressor-like RCC1 family protein
MNYVLTDTITGRSTTISSLSPENIYWTTGNNIYAFDASYYSYFLTGNYNFTNWELKDALYSSYPLGALGLKYFDPDSGILFFTDFNALSPQPWSMDVYTGNTSNNNILSGFQLAKTISGDIESAQNQYSFGISIDYKNNVLIAGSPGNYSSSYTAGSSGSAYIFTGSKNNWTRIIKLTGSNSTLPDFINNGFGASVSLNSQGNIAAVSSPFESAISNSNLNGFHKGCVYIFSGNNSNWTQTSRLTGNMAIIPANGSQDASFGKKIKLNSIGDTLYVLSAYSLNIFTGNNNTWNLAKTFTSTRATNTTPWPLDDFNLNKLENILYLSSGRFNYSIPYWQNNLGINIFSGSKSNWNENGQVILSNSTPIGYYPSTSFIPNFSGNILAIRGITQNSVPLTRTIQIYKEKLNQNITFPAISDKSFADPVFFLSGSSDSNLPISYSSSNALVASISGTTGVKINNVGSVTITANQAGNSDFEAAIPVSRSFNVFCDYIQSVSAGQDHSLAVLKDGRVTGWGRNDFGQTTIPSGIGTGAAQVSAGTYYYSLALLKDGRVTGWGFNNDGQTTIPVGIGTGAAGISAGYNHSLAVLKDGRATGWGYNIFGQTTIPAGIGTGAAQVIAGLRSSLALLKDGRVTGWGDNTFGQLNIPAGIGTNAAAISSLAFNGFALLKDGSLTGWGQDFYGETTIPVGIGTGAAGISAGIDHVLVLLKNGRVTGWGSNTYGAINIPTAIGTGAAQVSAGRNYNLVLLKDGRVTGWGDNGYGQTNVPKSINCTFGPVYQNITFPAISDKIYGSSPFYLSGFSDSNLPLTYSSSNSSIANIISGSGIQVNNFGNVTITASQNGNSNWEPAIPISQSFNLVCDYVQDISYTDSHILAKLKDNYVTGWGNNRNSQLNFPTGILNNVSQLSAGQGYSLAVLKDGRVTGWGDNAFGVFLNNPRIRIPNSIGTGAAQVSAGFLTSFAILKDGSIVGWGDNTYGQINIPVGIGTGAIAIDQGNYHALALLKDGRVTGWGYNGNNRANVPVDIGTGAAGISAGSAHNLVLLKDGRVTGWGYNEFGQIDIPVGIGTNAAQVSAGSFISFALLKDGRVTGWGLNDYGQINIPPSIQGNVAKIITNKLGEGFYYDRENFPISFPFALLKDGRVTGWGLNDIGYGINLLDIPRTLNCLPPNSSRVISAPTSTYILSGQNLSNAPLIGGSADVPGVFSWTNSSFVPSNVGRFSYSVTFVPSDIGSYTTSSTESFVNVLGIPNIITKPTGTSIKYGQALVNSNLADGVADTSGTFNWTNPQTIVNNTGINNYPVTFVPASQYYINGLTDANVNVTKADQTINFPNITDKILGASFVLNVTSNIGSTINSSTNDTDLISLSSLNNKTIVTLNSVGTATITAYANETEFYDISPSVSRTFNITQLPFISENDLNLRLVDNTLKNNLNFDIELRGSGSSLVAKSFDTNNNEPFFIGLQKDRAYSINVKSKEKLFEFGNRTGTKVISSNSYINTANLNIDFSQNEPQLDISTEVTDFLSLVYKLDDIITPSGIESVNRNQLKAFTIDYKTYITGEVLDIEQIPYLSYKKYQLENYCPPQQMVIQPTVIEENPCTKDFTCSICSSALKIRSNNPSQTFIDIPQTSMPFRIYGNLVDYIFTNTNPGFYRITLNDKLFSLCCRCKEEVECKNELLGDGGGGGGDAAFTQCKQDNLFDRPKNVNENSLNQKYGLYFLDAITLKSISANYGPYSYYSGEIKNANSFSEGDKIIFNQYSYNFEQAYADIYFNNPTYKPINAEFVYSSTLTGDKYFYTTSQLVDKINLTYNSTGIYTWLPILYSKKPYYNYGPMLFAELKDESTVGLISLKSGRLGEHAISLISAPKPNAIIKSYLVPKIIELQGSDDGLIWNKIISSKDMQPVNVLSTSYTKVGGNINYEAIDNTKVTREITVPISSTTGNRIVPSGKVTTSGELSDLIDQIESGNKQFETGNGATIVCIPKSGKLSKICGSGYLELYIPSGCPIPGTGEKEKEEKEDENGDKNQENTEEKTVLVEENVFRLGFTDYQS